MMKPTARSAIIRIKYMIVIKISIMSECKILACLLGFEFECSSSTLINLSLSLVRVSVGSTGIITGS